MKDVYFLLMIVGFFGLTWAYVRLCASLVRGK
jgi:hypothetical protein